MSQISRRLDACEDLPELPGIIVELREIIGWTAVIRLVEAYGGTPFFVPSDYRPGDALIRLIGARETVALIEAFRGERLYFPKLDRALRALRDREIVRKYREGGYTSRMLAREYNLSDRRIWEIIAAAGIADDNQRSLFDPS